jgi:hypothetical protein
METMSIKTLERKAQEKEQNYKIENGDYLCKTCGEEILAVNVTFSIHDGPFALSGSGKVTHQNFPYCPKCESKPEILGLPIN